MSAVAEKKAAKSQPPTIDARARSAFIPLGNIEVTGWNPRKTFDDDRLKELAESIAKHGVLQPVVVRPKAGQRADTPADKLKFELVVGERRWRASKLAGKETIPAQVRDLSDLEVVQMMIVENAERDDVHPLEEATGFQRLRDVHKQTPAEIASKIGMSLRHVQTRLQLLKLGKAVQAAFLENKVDATRASLLARIPDEKQQAQCLKEALGDDWNPPMTTRELEEHIAETYTRSLQGVPWKLDDPTLSPSAGACATCPKNARNMNGGKSADVCTDVACYENKSAAYWKHAQVALQKTASPTKGPVQILDEARAKGVFADGAGNGLHWNAPYVALTEKCPDDAKGRTFGEILKDVKVPVTMGLNPHTKKVQALVAKAGLTAALREAGVTSQRAKMAQRSQEQRKKNEEHKRVVALREQAAALAVGKIVAKAETNAGLTSPLWRIIARQFIAALDGDCINVPVLQAMATRRGLKDVAREIDRMGSNTLQGVALELAFIDKQDNAGYLDYSGEYSEALEQTCKLLGIDLKKLEKEVEAATPRAPSANSAQRLLQYAQDLNAGKAIVWPKDANALMVKYETKPKQFKVTHVVKGNEDTLKGVGLPVHVTFGKIKFAKQKPDWTSFEAVKG